MATSNVNLGVLLLQPSNMSHLTRRGGGGGGGSKRKAGEGDGDGPASKRGKAGEKDRSSTSAAQSIHSLATALQTSSVFESPEEIAAWIAARRAKFPTRARIEAKQQEQAQAKATGAVTGVRESGSGGRGRGRGRGGGRGRGRGQGMRGRGGRMYQPMHELALGDRSDYEDESSGGDSSNDDDDGDYRHAPICGDAVGASTASHTAAASASVAQPLPNASGTSISSSNVPSTTAQLSFNPNDPNTNPNWKRQLCKWERGRGRCRRPADRCPFLHRGEKPPPRTMHAYDLAQNHSQNQNHVTQQTMINFTPRGDNTGTDNNAQTMDVEHEGMDVDVTVAPQPSPAEADVNATMTSVPSPDAPVQPSQPIESALPVLAAPATATLSEESRAGAGPSTAISAFAAHTATAGDSANAATSITHNKIDPAQPARHRLPAALSPIDQSRVLQAIRFLVHNGPMRIREEEQMED